METTSTRKMSVAASWYDDGEICDEQDLDEEEEHQEGSEDERAEHQNQTEIRVGGIRRSLQVGTNRRGSSRNNSRKSTNPGSSHKNGIGRALKKAGSGISKAISRKADELGISNAGDNGVDFLGGLGGLGGIQNGLDHININGKDYVARSQIPSSGINTTVEAADISESDLCQLTKNLITVIKHGDEVVKHVTVRIPYQIKNNQFESCGYVLPLNEILRSPKNISFIISGVTAVDMSNEGNHDIGLHISGVEPHHVDCGLSGEARHVCMVIPAHVPYVPLKRVLLHRDHHDINRILARPPFDEEKANMILDRGSGRLLDKQGIHVPVQVGTNWYYIVKDFVSRLPRFSLEKSINGQNLLVEEDVFKAAIQDAKEAHERDGPRKQVKFHIESLGSHGTGMGATPAQRLGAPLRTNDQRGYIRVGLELKLTAVDIDILTKNLEQ